MVERQEVPREVVQTILAMATEGGPVPVPPPILAALCRAWLAVEDAPVGEYEYIVSNVAYIHFDNEGDAPNWSGDRVRIVKEVG